MLKNKELKLHPTSLNKPEVPVNSGEVDLRRRQVLGLLVLGGVTVLGYAGWRLGFKRFLKPSEQGSPDASPNTISEAKSEASQTSEINTAEPYEKWSRNIELPKIDFNPQAHRLTDKQLRDHLLSEYVDLEKLSDFFKKFDEMLSKIKSGDPMANRVVQLALLQVNLAEEYKKLLKPSCLSECIQNVEEDPSSEINRLLLMHGYWCYPNVKNKHFGPLFYKVKDVRPLTFSHGGKSDVIPFITTEESEKFSGRPEKGFTPSWIGAFTEKGDYIIFDEYEYKRSDNLNHKEFVKKSKQHSREKPPQESDFSSGVFNNVIHHEGMHAFCKRALGLSQKSTPLQLSKSINMGSYTLDLSDWGPVTEKQINELAGHGFGLMHSDVAAQMVAANLVLIDDNPSYDLAKKVLMDEIISSPYLPKHLKDKLLNSKEIPDEDWKIILSLPIAELHRIGERMAKLAIYLAQRMGLASSKKL